MKKNTVLVVLFILPIVAYLFFASGVTNFGKLQVLTPSINDAVLVEVGITLKDKITILGFLGKDISNKKGNAFNLNQKIYKRFYEFNDFQFLMVLPKGTETQAEELKKELANLADTEKWIFTFLEEDSIQALFSELHTGLVLNEQLATPYVFIIDKEKNVRGDAENPDKGASHGYSTNSVAELNNVMVDDVKIILAEYRLALKKNNANRKNQ